MALTEKGHLIREYKVINGNKVRYLSIPPSTDIELPSTKNALPSIKNELPSTKNDIGVVQNLYSPSTKNEPYKNINKNKNKNINKNPNQLTPEEREEYLQDLLDNMSSYDEGFY